VPWRKIQRLSLAWRRLAQYGPMPPRTQKNVLQQPTCPESGPGN